MSFFKVFVAAKGIIDSLILLRADELSSQLAYKL